MLSKQISKKKISHRNARETKWFGLLTLVPSSRAILAVLLATNILILCFGAFLARCLFDAIELIQAGAALRALASINIAESFGRTFSALGSATCRSGGAAWTLVAVRDCTGVGGILAESTSLAGEWGRAGGVVILSRWAAEETSLAVFEICWYSFSLP